MDIILLEKVRNLGSLGDRVHVKPGYGRNYLIPQGKAVSASLRNIEKFEARRAELEEKATEIFEAAKQRANALTKAGTITLPANASHEGKLFGSVGTSDIADTLSRIGITVQRKEIRLPAGPIRLLGEHEVLIQLHSEIVASLKILIVPLQ